MHITMKHTHSLRGLRLISFLLLAIGLFPKSSRAQQTLVSDYVMFSGNGGAGTTNPGSSGYGVIFGSSTTITNGAIGSYAMVKTTGNSNISANIFSGGTVVLANGN